MTDVAAVAVVTSTPEADPLALPLVREHLRLPPDQDQAILEHYLAASLAYAERYTSRHVGPRLNAGETAELAAFPAGLVVYPTEAPTFVACRYTDSADAVQSVPLGDFSERYDPRSRCWRLTYTGAEITDYKADSVVELEWRTVVVAEAAVTQARLMMIGHFYENTEAVTPDGRAVEVPLGAHALLDTFAEAPL